MNILRAAIFFLLPLGGAAAAPHQVAGPDALALAAAIAPLSPWSAGVKRRIARLAAGDVSGGGRTLSLMADSITCRVSNVDITHADCRLVFGGKARDSDGQRARILFEMLRAMGVAPDGAAGSLYAALSRLKCGLDPSAIAQKAGGGLICSFESD